MDDSVIEKGVVIQISPVATMTRTDCMSTDAQWWEVPQ